MIPIYAKITNQKVNNDMKILASRIENRYELLKYGVLVYFSRNQYQSSYYTKDNNVKKIIRKKLRLL